MMIIWKIKRGLCFAICFHYKGIVFVESKANLCSWQRETNYHRHIMLLLCYYSDEGCI